MSASGRAACEEVDLCGGVARPDNEPQYITDFYFYIGIASLSMDFQQPVRVMALRLRRVHPSKDVPPDRSCPVSSQGCPGAADPSFISTFYRQVRRSRPARSAASLAPAPHLPIVDLLTRSLSLVQMGLVLFTGLPILVPLPPQRLRHTGRFCNVARAVDLLRVWLCRAVCVHVLALCALPGRCVNAARVSYSCGVFGERE